ncbi:putative hydrolase [Paraliobacillus sp. PM-2]|uniref:HD domain-containing protein n=1 Tax=Paraliobacillus sp. PM-2 TaxID=1462524 RepID=UPI00061BA572|nr:HD domain-containing protein [Paraliobacillus sp. PM-2]CQR46645.1 putative hydrolase [Paraliobacillus sp. PM-2]
MDDLILKQTKAFILKRFQYDATGHDFAHMERVAKMSNYLARKENVDCFLAEMAGWLHDVTDAKLTDHPNNAEKELLEFLHTQSLTPIQINTIIDAIDTVSFRKGKKPNSIIGQVVQDADRLDAIGAIGIARAFSFGGNKNRPIYSEIPKEKELSTIQHFYDKLLLIKDKLHTDTAKQIASERHAFMEQYLNQFFKEWNLI